MKKYKFWIPGTLPGMNEIIAASKSGRGRSNAYSRIKKQWTDHICNILGTHPKLNRIEIEFIWMEKHKRRDPDNIASAKKFILDGMVKAGLIPNDGWKEIAGWKDMFLVDKKDPGVLVKVTEVR